MAQPARQTRDEKLLEAVAGGASLTDAARLAGMSRRTATRRAADPSFWAKVTELQKTMTGQTVARVRRYGLAAVNVIGRLMADADDDRVKLSAAQFIASQVLDLARQADVAEELERLEQELGELRERLDREDAAAAAGRNGRAGHAGRGHPAGS
jgi:hypothetical protein